MNSKWLLPVALLVPIFIVALVWSIASVYLFQTPKPQDFVTHAQKQNRGAHSIDRSDVGPATPKPNTDALASNTGSRPHESLSDNFGSVERRTLCQQFGPRGLARNMGAPLMPSYAPSGFNPASIETAGQDNYLSAVSQDGSFRWSAERMPIRVFISDGGSVSGYRPEFRKMIADAFKEWCNNSHGLLSWTQVNDPRQADVVCTWTNNPTIKPGSVEAGQTRTLVQTNRDTGEGRIVTAQISILTQFMGRPFSNENMYKTCLHEVGHALGLQGHSDVPSDIMYPTVNETQTAKLKSRDLNTLTYLYNVTGYTALNSTGSQSSEIGGVLPFTGSGGKQGYHKNRNSNRSNSSFGNGAHNDGNDVQQFGGTGNRRIETGDVQPFTGRRMQQPNDDGITPFTDRGMSQTGLDDGNQLSGTGVQQSDDDGITPFYNRRVQQGDYTRLFPGRNLMQPGSQQWQRSPGQGFGNRPRHHMHGNWARRAAIHEYMRRQAQQNGYYN